MKHLRLSGLLGLVLSLSCSVSTILPTPPPSIPAPETVLFQDDFSRPVSGWDRMLADEGIMDYDAGGYRILVNSLQTNFWSTPHQKFSDVRMEVDTGKLAGPDENRVGLICRFNGRDYYFFIISSDGFFGLGLYSGGRAVLLNHNEMQSSSSIKQGLAVNHLRADCSGNTLTFYVNGLQIAQAQDSTLSEGDVGLLAGTFVTAGVDIVFDNFVVLQP
ncbi:MAG: hypothetical protein Q7J80_05225 [Anaerolineales bacterium]|nr:hypothetical protein [Anaerolineales bacterium]